MKEFFHFAPKHKNRIRTDISAAARTSRTFTRFRPAFRNATAARREGVSRHMRGDPPYQETEPARFPRTIFYCFRFSNAKSTVATFQGAATDDTRIGIARRPLSGSRMIPVPYRTDSRRHPPILFSDRSPVQKERFLIVKVPGNGTNGLRRTIGTRYEPVIFLRTTIG